jgi:hypothetical protein
MSHRIPDSVPLKILAIGLGIGALFRLIAVFGRAEDRLEFVACLILIGAILSGAVIQWICTRRAQKRDPRGYFVVVKDSPGDDDHSQ